MKIDSDAYIRYALEFKEEERRSRREFQEWLPPVIIDSHTHVNLPEHVLFINNDIFHHMVSTFPSFSLAQSAELQSIFLPGIIIRALRFGFPIIGMDLYGTNTYIMENVSKNDRFVLCGVPTDVDYTTRMLKSPMVAALKMYYWFFERPATKIYEFFPPEILEVAQFEDKPIILHLPSYLSGCHDQLSTLLSDFPKLKVVLAHLGLFETVNHDTAKYFQEFACYDNVFLDTAMNRSADLLALSIDIFGTERIVYGSDEPLTYIRSNIFFNEELGWRLVTEHKYHWVDPDEHEKYKKYINNPIHELWSQLLTIQKVVERYDGSAKENLKQRIFHDNAKHLFGF